MPIVWWVVIGINVSRRMIIQIEDNELKNRIET